MNQFLFAIAFHLESDDWSHDHGGDSNECDEQYEGDQNVSALGAALRNGFSSGQNHLGFVIEKFCNWVIQGLRLSQITQLQSSPITQVYSPRG